MKKNKGLYIHVPFCSNICSYCDFCKFYYNENFVDKYLVALEKELDNYHINDNTTIYIGGGTPSSLNEEQFEKLLKIAHKYYKKGMSFTVEANVENLTLKKIDLLNKYDVNRVSLGVQTFNNDLLAILNRKHTKNDVFEVVFQLINHGITNINLDLIYGLPNQTIDMLKEDLELISTMPITHISTYSLMVNKNTYFGLKNIEEKSDDEIREMYDLIVEFLSKRNFYRYEVSNFSKKGFESEHNLIYWRNHEYYGVGPGASGYLSNVRYDNTKSLNKYFEGITRINEEVLTKEDVEYYKIMLGLRLSEGIEIDNIYYVNKVNDLIDKKLIKKESNRYSVTKENLFILDYILKKILY